MFYTDPYLGISLDCDEAFFQICGINRPTAVVGSQDFKVPHLSLKERGQNYDKIRKKHSHSHY